MKFYNGQKVICIDDRAGFIDGVKSLIKGKEYIATIHHVCKDEIFVNDGTNKSWLACRFAPVEEDYISEAHSKEVEKLIEENNLILN